MSDLIERLLREAEHRTRVGPKLVLLNEAADALEAKDVEMATLRAGLREIMDGVTYRALSGVDCRNIASETLRKALEGK
jgi:hypothetical protein